MRSFRPCCPLSRLVRHRSAPPLNSAALNSAVRTAPLPTLPRARGRVGRGANGLPQLCRKASRMKHNGRVKKLLCKLSQNVQARLSCFDDIVSSGRLHRERSRQQMLGIQQKCDSPRRDITFRRGNRPGVLHRCDLHPYGRQLFRGRSWRGRILSDLLRHSSNTLTFELFCHVRSAVTLVFPYNYSTSPTTPPESEGSFCREDYRD